MRILDAMVQVKFGVLFADERVADIFEVGRVKLE
jgi:hypothetical protein